MASSVKYNKLSLPTFPTYVISLQRATARRKVLAKRLQAINLPYEIIDATDEREGLTAKELNLIGGQENLRKYKDKLTPGALGCLISHLRCYEKLLNSEHQFAMVLEDDAKFHKNFTAILNATLKMSVNRRSLKSWYLINLGGWARGAARPFIGQETYPLNLCTRRVIKLPDSMAPSKRYYIGKIMAGVYGTHCYLISRSGCCFSLAKYPQMFGPIDYLMNDSGMPHSFLVFPSVAFQRAGGGYIGNIGMDSNTDELKPEVMPRNTSGLVLIHWLRRIKATFFILILRKPSSYYKRLLTKPFD